MNNHTSTLEQDVQHQRPIAENRKQNTLNDVSKNIVLHHLESFQRNDLEALLSDYTNESVLITGEATYTGPEEMKIFFAGLMIHFPTIGSSFQLDRIVAAGELVYIVWHATTPSCEVPLGSDTFVIKEGKIYQQTFAGVLNFTGQ